jgi:tetratricopeptide (TPR) repeat protein
MNRGDGRATEGVDIEAPSSDLSAASSASLYEAGWQHLQAGRHLEAQLCCKQALAIDAAHADSLQLMGLISLQAGQFDHAVQWLSLAIRQHPKTEYLSALGLTLKQTGRLEEALAVFDKTIQLEPDDAELWRQLGGALAALDRPTEAILAYQHALNLDPSHWDAAVQNGNLLHQMERFEEALAHFDLCCRRQPDNPPALFARARTLRALGRYEDSVADYRRLHAIAPDDPVVCNNAGDALLHLDRCEEGLEWFDRALRLKPGFVEVLRNRALALFRLHRVNEATAAYAQVMALDPDDAKSAWQLAHLKLLAGDFAAGWAEREVRWKVEGYSPAYPRFPQPKWLGKEDIAGKTLLICVDEGLGDALQFARYVPLLAARGATIILMVHEALRPLLRDVPGVSLCLAFGSPQWPPFDLHCPILSLPLACGTTLETIPPASYLPPLPAARIRAWDARLGPHDRLRIGLAWSGNPHHKQDGFRSMPFKTLLPLLALDATFVSLQKEIRPDDKALLDTCGDVIDPTGELTDFAETAALVENLDLVITVDTSIAHLAGTLGRPTWILLSFIGEWRWFDGRDDSPWYPSVRLFRQDERRDYARVVERVCAELQVLISSFRA